MGQSLPISSSTVLIAIEQDIPTLKKLTKLPSLKTKLPSYNKTFAF